MKSFIRSKKFIVILLLAGVVGFVGFNRGDDFKISKNLDIYYTLFRELNMFYVDEPNPEELVETSIDAMLESLDPYTKYISESEMDDFKFMTTGNYGGVGALIRKEGDYAIVSEPYKDFPADKAGLKAGDIIKKIDGESVKGWELEKISENLKGIPDTEVTLVVDRPGKEENLTKKVIRKEVHINSVPYYGMIDEENGTGYIRLSKFTQDCGSEVRQAYLDLEKNNRLKSIVLDLRNNPGGLLIEAVNVANIFVPKGQEIVSTKGRVEKWNETYKTENDPLNTEIPVAVLVNSSSASASEIVAGAIQDLDRGVVIGKRTYGKGLVQTARPLSYNTKLKVTTAKYYVPSGRSIQAKDYSNRKEDGSVGEMPDSLIQEFTTKNGRKVYDGGGIRPDIEVIQDPLSQIEISLLTKQLIFDFATQFAINNESIPPVEEYEVSDETYDEFKQFVKEKGWNYTTQSEEKLEKLIETVKKEKYYDRAEETIKELKEKLSHNKEKDLENFKNSIKDIMESEIVSRYYYQAGALKATLEEDVQLEKSKEVLADTIQYNNILSGKFKRHNVKIMEEKGD